MKNIHQVLVVFRVTTVIGEMLLKFSGRGTEEGLPDRK